MNKFTLFSDTEGNFHVCKSKVLKNDSINKKLFLVDDIPVSIILSHGKLITCLFLNYNENRRLHWKISKCNNLLSLCTFR